MTDLEKIRDMQLESIKSAYKDYAEGRAPAIQARKEVMRLIGVFVTIDDEIKRIAGEEE